MIKTRPFTFMLVAVSLDGKISPKRRSGQPNPVGPAYIDEEIMRLHNSQRAAVDGIMVGLNCILMDNSRLTLREGGGRSPTRIVLDGLAEMPSSARVLGNEAPTVVVVTRDAPARRIRTLEEKGANIIVSGKGRFVDLPPVMEELSRAYGIKKLMVEGGGTVHRSMIAQNLYDELHLIICPFVIGGSGSITPAGRTSFWPRGQVPFYSLAENRTIGDYIYLVYKQKG
jgi:2,5-diamino-6-(ribosylamino)-4(3H)-pyrimidinone 5'-phosphate reductase